jgi:uncharacterized protein YegL
MKTTDIVEPLGALNLRQGPRRMSLRTATPPVRLRSGLRCISALAILASSLALARAQDSLALAIILDTSGSMLDSVRDTNGMAPKYIIARRALEGIADKLQRFAAANPMREIQVCALTFDDGKPSVKLPLAKFDAAKLKEVAQKLQPKGGTPLGNALTEASALLSKSTASKKHIFMITDGMNTIGPDVTPVWKNLKTRHPGEELHLIAFDVKAAQFDPVKKLGATVVGASDALELNTRIDYILEKKILLEAEEPPAKK